jgi:hypothetical protein
MSVFSIKPNPDTSEIAELTNPTKEKEAKEAMARKVAAEKEEEVKDKLLKSFLKDGESFYLTSQEDHTNEKGSAVEDVHAKHVLYSIALQRAEYNAILKKEAEEDKAAKEAAVKEKAHARLNLWGDSAEEYAFHEIICKLEEMRGASKDDKERSAIGELIETMLDFDEKVQEKTSLNSSTKMRVGIPTQFNEKKKSLYSSANDALKEIFNPLPGKFIHAIQTAKDSIQGLINSVTNLLKVRRVSLGDSAPSLINNPNCLFPNSSSAKGHEAAPPVRRNSII